MKNRFTWLAVGAILALAVMAFSGLQLALASQATYHGSVIDPPAKAPDFTLTTSRGEAFTLSEAKGKVVLIFFGYTNCPDVCPATMAQFTQLKKDLGGKANDVVLVFITVDPQRDTPVVISDYLSSFDPSIKGLVGPQEALAGVWKKYGVAVEYTPGATQSGYQVSHSDRVYAIDRSGNLRLTYSFGTPQADLENDVKLLLKEKTGS